MKKDWRERELTMEVIVGAFLVMIFLGLGYFTIILSREAFLQESYELKVSFSEVMGLREGDNVMVRGMPVGKVKSLTLDCTNQCSGVLVTLSLDIPVKITEGYKFTIHSTSLLGGKHLEIFEGYPDGAPLDLAIYTGKTPYNLMGDAAAIVNSARTELIEGGVFENIREVADQVGSIVARVNAGEGTLGRLLSDDDTMYRDLEASVGALREIMEGVNAGEGVAGQLLKGDGNILTDLEEALASLKEVARRLEAGEGTVGKLMADDEVYVELESTISEVRAAVDDFRETAPVTTFSSIFFGAF